MSDLAAIATAHGTLLFAPWPTDVSIFDADSHEAIEILTPILGPTCVIALHHITRRLQPPTLSTTFELSELSHACGGGPHPATNTSRIIRTLVRLEQFGYLRHDGNGHCDIRTHIPPLPPARITRLPREARALLATLQHTDTDDRQSADVRH